MARKMTFSGQKYNSKPAAKKDEPKKSEPVTEASKKKHTDTAKKKASENPTAGTKLAKPGQTTDTQGRDMRETQNKSAKSQAEMYKAVHGVYPTPENIKKYGKSYMK
jgi:hypothetical protein